MTLVWGFLLIFSFSLLAAESIADMEKSLVNATGTDRVDLLNRLAFSYWSKDPKKGIAYGLEALDLGRKLNYQKGMARSLNCLGLNCWVKGEYVNALDYYKQSLDIARAINDKTSMANTLNNMGIIYIDLGRKDLALENYFQTLKIKEEQKDTFGVARALNNIGEVFLELKRYDEALSFLQKSLAMKKTDAKDQEGLASAYQNIGEVQRARGDFKSALENFQQSLDISRQVGKKIGVASAYFSMAEVYLVEGDRKKALDAFSKSMKIREDLGDKKGIASCLNRIGFVQMGLGNYEQAKPLLEKAMAMAEELAIKKEIINSLEYLSDLYAARHDYIRSLYFFKKCSQTKDQVYNQESSQKISNLSMLYENEQRQKEMQLQRLRLEKQKQLGYLFVIIIGLILLLMFFVYNRYRLKVRVNLELEQMNTQLDLLTRIDPLTQLANRRDFVEKITYEIARYMRSRKVFSVIMGDIDDFKKVNDQFGHECGDYVLVTIAQLIREMIREQDVVARWGGEEFILLLPETDPEGSKVLSQRICDKVARHTFAHNGFNLNVTMTFGIAAYIEGLKIDDCISLADHAMYEGKIRGKNRVVLQGA